MEDMEDGKGDRRLGISIVGTGDGYWKVNERKGGTIGRCEVGVEEHQPILLGNNEFLHIYGKNCKPPGPIYLRRCWTLLRWLIYVSIKEIDWWVNKVTRFYAFQME